MALSQVDETATDGEQVPTKCIWCDEVLTASDSPKLLECLHVACGSCVTTKFSEIDRTLPPLVHCPLCNMASQLDHIIENQFLMEQQANEDTQSSNDADSKVKTNFFEVSCSMSKLCV